MKSPVENNYRADIRLKVEGNLIKFQIDTGASVNVLDEKDLTKLKPNIKIETTDKRIFPYGNRTPLPLLGKFQATVRTFYIAKHTSKCMGSLLGLQSAVNLELLSIVNNITERKGVDQT